MKNIKNSTKKSNQGEKMMNKVNSTEKSNQGEKMMNRVVNNMKEENKTNMKREGKTGMDKKIRIAAMTTVTAVTGVMIGQPATMAFAAEEQGNVTVTAVDEYSINAAMQNSTKVPDMNELKSVVEVTKKEADDAQTAYDTSKETAQKAFEEAVSKAEAVKNQAETEYKKSETNLTDASSADEQAGQEVEGAKREVEKTTQDLSNAEAGTGVSDADLSAKEEEVAAAKTRVEDAKENIVAAENTVQVAAGNLADKEMDANAAESAWSEAEKEAEEAKNKVEEAQKRVDKLAEDLEDAEAVLNGKKDLAETNQYKDAQEAKENLDSAQKDAVIAGEDADQARARLQEIQEEKNQAEEALDNAVKDYNEKKQKCDTAASEKESADAKMQEAKAAYERAENDLEEAQKILEEAEAAKEKAEYALEEAKAEKEKADQAVKEAGDELEKVKDDASAEADKKINDAKEEVSKKEADLEQAQKAVEEAEGKYNQGTLGFIDWMLSQDGLSKDQIQDLTAARKVLSDASEEDFSKWAGGNNTGLPEERNGKVIVIGDKKDATNLENLKRSIAIMKKINELRASDDNFTEEMRRNPSCTNFFFMATAEAGAMRGAGLRRHSSLTTSCENLSFNKEDPTLGWYTKEKAIFDRIKNELGITKLTAETLQQIEEEAANQGVVIGHYTNLFWAVDQAMGVGYTQYGMTSCYNASNASNVTDDSYNRGKHLYTVEEFEAILNQYYALTDTESCNQMLETAKSELESAEEEVRNLEDNKDALIEAVIREANEAYQQRANDAQEAQKALNNAEMHVSETKSAYEAAAKNADMLQQNMEAAKESFEKSESADAELEEKISEMQSETDDAYEKVKEAEAAVNAAMQEETVAKESLKEKLELLDKANQVYEDAKKAFQEASANLDNITNGTFVEKIRKEKTAADAELAQAAGVKDEKCKILADKEAEFEAAKNHLAKAKEEYETASTEADSARTAYANAKTEFEQLSSELSSLNESYAPVLTAKTALAEAEEKLEQAYTRKEETAKAYEAAKEYYETAKAAWEEAEDKFDRASKISFEDALTEPVTDEDFIYLNDYVNDFLEKERELAEADDKYKFAKAALEAAQENSKLSDRDYLVDYVSKLVEENNRPSGGVQKLSQTTNSTDKETFSDAGTVKTGDTVKTGGWLAGMLAGAGILAIVGKRKKKEVHYGKAGKNGSKRI